MSKQRVAAPDRALGPVQEGLARSGRKLRTFDSLRVPSFRWYWLGSLATFMAFGMQEVARGWLVYDLTESPLALGIAGSSFGIPMMLLSLLGGALADRISRKSLIVVTQGLIALTTLLMAVLVYTELIEFWHLVAIGMLTGAIFAFNMPGRQALVPDLVGEERLLNAFALNSAGMSISRIVGPALAGAIVAGTGVAAVFYIIVGFNVFATLSLWMVRPAVTNRASSKNTLARDIAEGVRYVRRNGTLTGLLVMAFVPVFFGMPFQALLPAFVVEDLGREASALGVLISVTGAGAAVGSLALASFSVNKKGILMILASASWGLALVAMTVFGNFNIALVALFGLGVGSQIYMTINNTLVQVASPPEMRGRVMSIMMMTFGLMPLSILPAGAIAEVAGTGETLAVGGVILIVVSLAFGALHPTIKKL